MSIRTPTRRRPTPRRHRPAPRSRTAAPAYAEFDRAYWLAHCEGFRVDAAEGRIGFVESVRDGGPHGAPILSVRAGRLGRHVLSISTATVAFIVPRAEGIWLTSPVQPVDHPAAT